MADATIKVFGIRHHGPGCSLSLLSALETFSPDILLVEGPPDADDVIPMAARQGMTPPVAILVHEADHPENAVFYPFTQFSPEWVAIRHALDKGIPAKFMDLPFAQRPEEPPPQDLSVICEISPEGSHNEVPIDDNYSLLQELSGQVDFRSPLDWFAEAAGYDDGESWWNHMVEERGDGAEMFDAIMEAMTVLRTDFPSMPGRDASEEAMREASMRKIMRQAQKDGFVRIAVVCGAWHAPVLDLKKFSKKDDDETLKGLPKRKIKCTWVPWSYAHISQQSGYGAGIESPGWYEHLWTAPSDMRTISWFGKVAATFRENDIDCSSAHIIEAARLSEALAAMREKPFPGLSEIDEAIRSVVCMGDDAPMTLIRRDLLIGDRTGTIPDGSPTVPLQADIEGKAKSLRLKMESTDKSLVLDLRQPNDLERSRFFHRLSILGIKWARQARDGHSSKGTFRESWLLGWDPASVIGIVSAARYGNTILKAASSMLLEHSQASNNLAELSGMLNSALMADLPDLIPHIVKRIDSVSAVSSDLTAMMDGVPTLVQTLRYGNVRKSDNEAVRGIVEHMIERICVGLPVACSGLDDDGSMEMRTRISSVDDALPLIESSELTEAWRASVIRLFSDTHPPLLSGKAVRLAMDHNWVSTEDVSDNMSRALSAGSEPAKSASWIDGFLDGGALVLVNDPTLLGLVDEWVSGMSRDHFDTALPFLRRGFSAFERGERSMIGDAVSGRKSSAVVSTSLDMERADRVLPVLLTLLGDRV